MLLLGCRPKGRHIEQHDILFAIASNLKETVPAIKHFWPEVKNAIHIDVWREVTVVDGYTISIVPHTQTVDYKKENNLFFINLGGYKKDESEEYHYKLLVVAKSKELAIAQARQSAFYKHTGIKGAPAHIDDKYGVDADDIYELNDMLSPTCRDKYSIEITPTLTTHIDTLHIGYLPLFKI